MSISLFVIDDEYLVRLGIRETIDWEQYGFSIVGEASDGRRGLEAVLRLKPDIILTDIRMPFMDGLEFMHQIRQNGLDSKIVVLSGYAEFDYVKTALDNGASAYLLKPIDNDKLIRTILRLGQEITQQQKQQEEYDRLKGEIPVLRERFYKDLLSGGYKDSQAMREKCELIGLSPKENNIVVVIRMDHYAAFQNRQDPEELSDRMKYIENRLIGQMPENKSHDGDAVIPGEPGVWTVILHVAGPVEPAVVCIKEQYREVTDELEASCNISFSIGISGLCQELADIPEGSRQAKAAADYKLMPGVSSVVSYDEVDSVCCRREIRSALEYIKDHYPEEITIEDTARAVYLSPDHLMHLFRSELGRTFNECLTGYRIEMARKLLKDPQFRINQVARMVGYRDAKYFSQLFRKITGMLPSDYTRQYE